MNAKNAETCDCETPGDWHQVANDFQRAMFDEQRRTETVKMERDAAFTELERLIRFLPSHTLLDDARALLYKHGHLLK